MYIYIHIHIYIHKLALGFIDGIWEHIDALLSFVLFEGEKRFFCPYLHQKTEDGTRWQKKNK